MRIRRGPLSLFVFRILFLWTLSILFSAVLSSPWIYRYPPRTHNLINQRQGQPSLCLGTDSFLLHIRKCVSEGTYLSLLAVHIEEWESEKSNKWFLLFEVFQHSLCGFSCSPASCFTNTSECLPVCFRDSLLAVMLRNMELMFLNFFCSIFLSKLIPEMATIL